MRYPTFGQSIFAIAVVVAAGSTATAGPVKVVDCSGGQSLANAVSHANPGDVFRVSGTCHEQVRVTTESSHDRGPGDHRWRRR